MALATGALPAPSPRGGTTRAGRRRSSPSLAGAPSPIAGDGPPPPSPATGSGRRRPSAPSLPLRPPSPTPDLEWRAAGPSSFPSMAGGRIRRRHGRAPSLLPPPVTGARRACVRAGLRELGCWRWGSCGGRRPHDARRVALLLRRASMAERRGAPGGGREEEQGPWRGGAERAEALLGCGASRGSSPHRRGKKEGLSPPFHLHVGSAIASVMLTAELNRITLKG